MAQDNSIAQKTRKRCENHKSIIECDGWVGPDEGSHYCSGCRTLVSIQCQNCSTMFRMPRGLYQILNAQNKKVKCFRCLSGTYNPIVPKKTVNKQTTSREDERRARCTVKLDGICLADAEGLPYSVMLRLHSTRYDPALGYLPKGPICSICAEQLWRQYPGTAFVRASGRHAARWDTPYHPPGNAPGKTNPITVRPFLWNPDEVRQTAISSAQMHARERGGPKKFKDPFYWAQRKVLEQLRSAESVTNHKIFLGTPRAILFRLEVKDTPAKVRWGYVEEAIFEINRFLRRLVHDANLQRRCGIA